MRNVLTIGIWNLCSKINSKLGYDFSVRKLPFIIVTLFIIMSIFQGHILLSWLLYVCCASLMSINNISYNSCLQKSIEDTNRGTILSLRSLLIAVTGMLISPLVGHFLIYMDFLQHFCVAESFV